jgi:hypothetical protein
MTWLPRDLPGQLQELLSASRLPPTAVQSGRLVENLSNPPQWSLELTVALSEQEGEAVLGSLLVDRSETPEWEVRSDENAEAF